MRTVLNRIKRKTIAFFAIVKDAAYARVWVLTGKERNSGEDVTVLYIEKPRCVIGTQQCREVFIEHLIEGSPRVLYKGHSTILSVLSRSLHRKYNCNFTVVDIHRSLLPLMKRIKGFYIPHRTYTVLDVVPDMKTLFTRSSYFKRAKKKVEQYSYECHTSGERIEYFYEKMYKPYVKNRFSDNAHTWKYDRLSPAERKRYEVLLVKQDDTYVGGGIIYYNPYRGYPVLWVIGVLDGDEAYVRDYVLHAVYLFTVEELKNRGYEKVGLTYISSFIDNSITSYKMRWGPDIENSWMTGYYLILNRDSASLESFLAHNPFISADDDTVHINLFLDSDWNDDMVRQEIKKWSVNGIAGIKLHHFHDMNDPPVTAKQYNTVPVSHDVVCEDSG